MSINIFELIQSRSPEHIVLASNRVKELGASGLLELHNQTYGNIFLFAARFGTFKIVCEIFDILYEACYGEEKQEIGSLYDVMSAVAPLDGTSAIILASIDEDVPKLEYLVQLYQINHEIHGQINYRDSDGYSALSYTIKGKQKEKFKYLLLNGAEFSKKEEALVASKHFNYFNTPECFLIISESGNISAMKFIKRHIITQPLAIQNTFLTATNESGQNALMIATSKGHKNLIPYLLSFPELKISMSDNAGRSTLNYLSSSPFKLTPPHAGPVKKELKEDYDTNQSARKNLLASFQEAKEITQVDAKAMCDNKWFFEDVLLSNTKKGRGDIADVLEYKVTSFSKSGKTTKRFPEPLQRPYRSYSGDRERQVLKHISTQLHFKLQEQKVEDLVEVEAMHLIFNGKNYLFIGVNTWNASSSLKNIITSSDVFKNILLNKYQQQSHEGKIRSERYANKLAERVFNEEQPTYFQDKHTEDGKKAHNIAVLLRQSEIHEVMLSKDEKANSENIAACLDSEVGCIYLVNISEAPAFKGRHIEEFFTDIVEWAKAIGVQKQTPVDDVYSCISGKKRPCMGCFSRMLGEITLFGKHPGLHWKQTMEGQPIEVARSTIEVLLTKQPCVSLNKNGKVDEEFDSGSDSDSIEDNENKEESSSSSPASSSSCAPAAAATLPFFSAPTSQDSELQKAIDLSLKTAIAEGKVGPEAIQGWKLENVKSDGNCFYRAVIEQMRLINHTFLDCHLEGTEDHDRLRLKIQGREFKDGQWADVQEIEKLVLEFDLVLAIVDTRSPQDGLHYYYKVDNDSISDTKRESDLDHTKKIIKLAYTGNHYLSVLNHPQEHDEEKKDISAAAAYRS